MCAALLGSFLMTSVYQGICVTAAMFFTGQASNPLAARIATETFHYPVTWVSWFLAHFAASELAAMGPMSAGEKIVLAVFLSVCGLWITSPFHKIDIAVTALLGSCALLLSGVLSWEDVKSERAAWDIFIWYGGLLRLGKALGETGVTVEFARGVGSLLGGAGWVVLFACALLIYFYTHYGFASITAHILAMYPAFLAVLLAKGAPIGLMVYAFACFANLSAGLTNYGTTPSPMFFAQDYVSLKKWWSVGFVVSLANLAIWTTVGFAWWKLLGIW